MKPRPKAIRRLGIQLLALQTASFLALAVIAVLTNQWVKTTLGQQVAREARRHLLVQDFREAIYTVSQVTVDNLVFRAVSYVLASGKTAFTLPVEMQPTAVRHIIEKPPFWTAVVRVPVLFSEPPGEPVGEIVFVFDRFSHLGYALGIWMLGLLASIPLIVRAQRRLLREQEDAAEAQRNVAIAETARMMAHDVRKPFSTLRFAIGILQTVDTVDDLRAMLKEVVPDVNHAIRSVEEMVQDILEFGSPNVPTCEAVSPAGMIHSSLREAFRGRDTSSVEFSYSLEHTTDILADTCQVARVLVNIIDNAIHAMNGRGRIWFSTRNVADGGMSAVEIRIGNDGPPIPESDLPLLFDTSFTRKRQHGTGLGLAIARKIVHAHGGSIDCVSSSAGATVFRFTLPAATTLSPSEDAVLPSASKDLIGFTTRSSGLKTHVLVVDDDPGYLSMMSLQMRRAGLSVTAASTSDEALEKTRAESPNLVICDVDLGPGSMTGIELVTQLRGEGLRVPICLHSNHWQGSQKDVEATGADVFVPKPMTDEHLAALMARCNGNSGTKEVLA